MGLLTQLGLLLWKNFTLRKRQKVRLVVELLWPLFLFFILVWVRSTTQPIYQGECHYPNKAMPSAGVLPWLQGMMCNIDNPCVNHSTPGEAPGQVNNFNNSIIAGMLIELQSLLANRSIITKIQTLSDDVDQWVLILQTSNHKKGQPIPLRSILNDNEMFTTYLRENLSMPSMVANSLITSNIRLNEMIGISRQDDLRITLCNGTALDRYVEFSSASDKEAFQKVSCSLTAQQLRQTGEVFLQNLDTRKMLTNLPSALDLTPSETFGLVRKTTEDALPVLDEMNKLQNSMLLKAADMLDFRADTFGSLNILLCGKTPNSNSTKTTMNFPAFGAMRNDTENNVRSSNSSAFCKVLIDTLEGTPGLRIVWRTFRPLIQGKILYTPDTPATRLMVKEANSTFNALAMLKELLEAWEDFEPRGRNYFQNGPQVSALRAFLDNPVFAAALSHGLKGTRWTEELLANFLYNRPPEDRPAGMPPNDWRDVFNATSQILDLLKKFIGCLDLDKFEAVDSEGHLVARALELLENDTYWAGIVFEELDPAASHPPPYVKYKIRLDIDEGESTRKIKERGWSPGARDSVNNLRYIWGGFAYLQDMMDHGIIRLHTNKSQPLGVFAQQMPYPCYVDDVFLASIGTMLPMYLVLAFMYTVCMIIKGLVLEKELRLKEVQRAVGVQNGAIWFAWFTENFVLLMVPCAFISVMVKVSTENDD